MDFGQRAEPAMLRTLVTYGFVALCLAGLAHHYADRFNLDARAPAAATTTNGDAMLAVPRGANGQFQVDAVVGGQQVSFLIDTGASLVVLTAEEAARLGIRPSAHDRTARMQTANGVVEASRVRLAEINVGPLTVQDVEAVVMPKGRLGQNLLGMSFLSRLRRFEFRTGALVMEQ
jgi:aspartyl protease family protein